MQISSNSQHLNRLIALWALTEAGLGGVLHAFKMPLTGLVIAGLSIIYISLIGSLKGVNKNQIIKATLIVLAIKMIISPHTPPTAYFAVLFQGFSGYVIFKLSGVNRITIYLFAVIALLQSGLQKLIVLTIFYGRSIWESIDALFDFIEKELTLGSGFTGSYLLITVYISLHVISGFFYAAFAVRMKKTLNMENKALINQYLIFSESREFEFSKKKNNKWGKTIWIFLVLILIIAALFIFNPDMKMHKAWYILIRTVLIVILWYTVLIPLTKYIFTRFIEKQKTRYSAEINELMSFFPVLNHVIRFAYQTNKPLNTFKKLNVFLESLIYLTFHTNIESNGEDHHTDRSGS